MVVIWRTLGRPEILTPEESAIPTFLFHKPSPAELLPVYTELFSRPVLQRLLAATHVTMYWRALTPLVMLWALIYQRLNADHTCDAVVSYLRQGGADTLDPLDPHCFPLSRRLGSESTAGYVQGRQRFSLLIVHATVRIVLQRVQSWLQSVEPAAPAPAWRGQAVRLLDGTTFRMRPQGDLVATYGQHQSQNNTPYWVVAKSVAAFCLHTRLCVAHAEGSQSASEPALASSVMRQDPCPHSIYVGDRGFGVYRVAQVAHALHHAVVLRLEVRTAKLLFRQVRASGKVRSGTDCGVAWAPAAHTQVEPDLPTLPIAGRVIYVCLQRQGFRPIELYLFTTVMDRVTYSVKKLCALYGLRWHVELDYRRIKVTLEMAQFAVQSAAMFQLELAVGLLTYNLICALMVKAAQRANVSPWQLSFNRCWRRIREVLTLGLPTWAEQQGLGADYLLQQLARCRLPQQRNKVAHEPRQVRSLWRSYPSLHGDRNLARAKLLADMSEQSIS